MALVGGGSIFSDGDSLDAFTALHDPHGPATVASSSIQQGPSVVSSSLAHSSLVTNTDSVKPNKLSKIVEKANHDYVVRRYIARVTSKGARKEEAKGPKRPLAKLTADGLLDQGLVHKAPLPLRPDRARLMVNRLIHDANQNRAPECQLYLPNEGKYLCVDVDPKTGKNTVKLMEADRYFPSRDCGNWRIIPADRTSRDKRLLIQNVFSNCMLGHDPQGNAVCVNSIPTQFEHLALSADEENGLLRIVCPHWHWERGAPFVVKGTGKRNTKLLPKETAYLEAIAKVKNTENPFQTLRLGYGGMRDASALGWRPALFQPVWDLPPHAQHAPEGKVLGDVKLNWLGQSAVDFSREVHRAEEGWRSPYKARILGIIP